MIMYNLSSDTANTALLKAIDTSNILNFKNYRIHHGFPVKVIIIQQKQLKRIHSMYFIKMKVKVRIIVAVQMTKLKMINH